VRGNALNASSLLPPCDSTRQIQRYSTENRESSGAASDTGSRFDTRACRCVQTQERCTAGTNNSFANSKSIGERHRVLHSTFDRVTRAKAVAVSSFQLCAKYPMPIGRHDHGKRRLVRRGVANKFAEIFRGQTAFNSVSRTITLPVFLTASPGNRNHAMRTIISKRNNKCFQYRRSGKPRCVKSQMRPSRNEASGASNFFAKGREDRARLQRIIIVADDKTRGGEGERRRETRDRNDECECLSAKCISK
jgi:hypothetical protein